MEKLHEITKERYREVANFFYGFTPEGEEPSLFPTEPTTHNGWFGWVVYFMEDGRFFIGFVFGSERPSAKKILANFFN